ncbi:hypothetical protein C5167_008958 [Papaver somniferum]|uniref:Homeobox domain-containing protein n=1 Tax=Papaver somniferum TaxID=3469 RepID=A0A4Y7JZZ9_PAPSO|nr:hypothetical protein C5167_008958 [Papaver somniferum]
MASSNRHWPSMFKSKPCDSHPQWQHEINPSSLMSSCQRPSYTPSGNEERTLEPKPRWNPKPEQIRILEAIFNAGMVNPPRDEIRKIRAQLQEYGQVGDANVFYWFQNRKSRSKHKQRHSTKSSSSINNIYHQPSPKTLTAPSSSSSSSSEKSSPKKTGNNKKNIAAMGTTGVNFVDALNSPTDSVNQTYFQTTQGELISSSPDPFFFSATMPVQQSGIGSTGFTQGFCFSELPNVIQYPSQNHHQGIGQCSSLLLGELLHHGSTLKKDEAVDKLKDWQKLSYTTTSITSTSTIPSTVIDTIPSSTITSTTTGSTLIHDIQGGGGIGESGDIGPCIVAKSTVFINDIEFEVSMGPLNVRQAFGYDAVLIHSSGQPVFTNEWGFTLQSLQPGASYYLVRIFS